ncbi:MAG: hypothetical protein QXU52_00645 [Fervidicoccaceae archaeon]
MRARACLAAFVALILSSFIVPFALAPLWKPWALFAFWCSIAAAAALLFASCSRR